MIEQRATAYLRAVAELMQGLEVTDEQGKPLSLDEGANGMVELILSTRATSHKVLLVGNGGSAAIASHIQNDLCKMVGVRAMASNEPPLLTALANDDGYACVFERQVDLWANKGDLIIAISSSGKSENILRAVRAAKAQGCQAITLSGFDAGNPLRRMGQLNFYVSSSVYGYVEVVHATLTHFAVDCAAISGGKKLS